MTTDYSPETCGTCLLRMSTVGRINRCGLKCDPAASEPCWFRDRPTPAQLATSDAAHYSPLAWELAQNAKFDNAAGTVSATVYVRVREGASGRLGDPVTGHGPTTTEAMRDLARQLDTWAHAR